MRPVYDDGAVRLYQGDARELLPRLSGWDHVIADPPYSAHVHASAVSRRRSSHAGHGPVGVDLGFASLAPSLRRGIAEACGRAPRWSLVFCDAEGLAGWAGALARAGLEHVRVGAWVRDGSAPQFTGDRPASGFECVEIAHPPGRKRWNGGGRAAVWRHTVVRSGRVHPSQKPQALMEELVAWFTDPGETVLDPCAGSGTLGVACKKLGRKAILIESDPAHAAAAAARLAAQPEPLPVFCAPHPALFGESEAS